MPEAAGPNKRLPAVLRRPQLAPYRGVLHRVRPVSYSIAFSCGCSAYPPRSVPPQPIGDLRPLRGIGNGLPLVVVSQLPVRLDELARDDGLAVRAIQHEELPIAGRLREELPRLTVDGTIEYDSGLRRIPVVRVVGRSLEVPN